MRSILSIAALAVAVAALAGCSSTDDQGDGGADDGGLPDSGNVIVPPGPPVISSFAANPATLAVSGSTTLDWTVTDADTLSIDQGVGVVTGTTSKSVTVPATTTFTLTATNSHGTSAKVATVTVTTPAPAIGTFTATPNMLSGSGTVVLAWTVTGATSVAIDSGVGDVTGRLNKSLTVKATTTFTLTATGPGGSSTAQALVTVATDLYVDSATGDNANAGTATAPFKTVTKAASLAQPGDTIHLADGVYDPVNEAGSSVVNIPGNVTVQAAHGRAATIRNLSLIVPTGSGTFVDLQLDGASAAIFGNSSAAGSTLTLTGIEFANSSRLVIQGAVKATMNAGTFSGSHSVGGVGFAGLQGTGELVVHGGVFDGAGAGQGSFGGGLFTVANNAKLTLDGVSIKNWNAAAVYIGGPATINPPSLTLQGGTVLDNVGGLGNCGAAGALILSGQLSLTIDNAQITNSKNTAICVRLGSKVTAAIKNGSKLTGNQWGLVSEPGGGTNQLTLTVDSSTFNANTTAGIEWTWDGSLTFNTSTFDSNGSGVLLLPGGTNLSVKARNSTFKNNTTFGLSLQTDALLDLGSAGDQGQDSFTGDGVTGLNINSPTPGTVSAGGNSWNPNQQGADASGKYPANTNVVGPVNTGTNYQITGTSTLDL